MSRILILSASHLCRNPRVLKEATALGRLGHAVTVLTVSSSARFEALDRPLLEGAPFCRESIDLTSDAEMQSLVSRGRTRLARSMLKYTGIESAGALGPTAALLERALAHPADLTIAHTEPALWVAMSLHREGRRVAVDFEDWYSEDLLEEDRRSRPLQLLASLEAEALANAEYCSAPSEAMAAALAGAHRSRTPIVVRNTFPLRPPPQIRRPVAGETRFVWFSQTVGPGRGLEAFVSSWGRTIQPSRLVLIGDMRPGFEQVLRALVPAEKQERISALPLMPPAELSRRLPEFDIGLALEPKEPRNKDLTTSNKVFQYLEAGLAVISTDTAGQREVAASAAGSGIVVNDLDAPGLSETIDQLLTDPARVYSMKQAARSAAEERFNWSVDEARLFKAVGTALHGGSTT